MLHRSPPIPTTIVSHSRPQWTTTTTTTTVQPPSFDEYDYDYEWMYHEEQQEQEEQYWLSSPVVPVCPSWSEDNNNNNHTTIISQNTTHWPSFDKLKSCFHSPRSSIQHQQQSSTPASASAAIQMSLSFAQQQPQTTSDNNPQSSSLTTTTPPPHMMMMASLLPVSTTNTPLPPRPPRARALSTNSGILRNNNNNHSLSKPVLGARKSSAASGQPQRVRLDSNSLSCANRARLDSASSTHKRNTSEFLFSTDSMKQILVFNDSSSLDESQQPAGQQQATTSLDNGASSLAGNSWATLPMSTIRCAVLERDCSELKDDDFLYGTTSSLDDDEFDNDNQENDDNTEFVLSRTGSSTDENRSDGNSSLRLQRRQKYQSQQQQQRHSSNESSSSHGRSCSRSPTSVSCAPVPDWMVTWAHENEFHETTMKGFSSSSITMMMNNSPKSHSCLENENDDEDERTYLPCSTTDSTSLGWMAVSRGDTLLTTTTSHHCWKRDDLGKVDLVMNEDASSLTLVFSQWNCNTFSIPLNDCFVTTELVSPQVGRAVVVRDRQAPHVIRCALLPVSLPKIRTDYDMVLNEFLASSHQQRDAAAATNVLDSSFLSLSSHDDDDSSQQQQMFAPDAQQDAARNVLFRLDLLLKQQQQQPRWRSTRS